ncbi:SMI1/KNR4 family protein [Tenacibaculum sp. 1B UA]|uniref:SMI1/KNR4 family protein n=1 Tax=unclassified Tenacibaculum TaxID=2635139 RepID=UPI0026E436AF|nr:MULTISPECIES: SMI1/KNR4 family protein [unclassified Tenacibaculum]MDO6675016.1 SMI1/KNR4 family protein [Tenacibaculum sp. 1_MG-2023]MDX8554429.1 SMI1/KNR4 family protein [Tenacibaculum sp. 1B UA]
MKKHPVTYRSPNYKPSKAEVLAFEQNYKIHLPTDYFKFLLNHNGGSPEPCLFTKNPDLGIIVINWLNGLLKGKNGLVWNIEIFDGRIPKRFLAIGDDPGGNQICLDVSLNNTNGAVYFWKHEEEYLFTNEEAVLENMYFLANSFESLITSLVTDEEL